MSEGGFTIFISRNESLGEASIWRWGILALRFALIEAKLFNITKNIFFPL